MSYKNFFMTYLAKKKVKPEQDARTAPAVDPPALTPIPKPPHDADGAEAAPALRS